MTGRAPTISESYLRQQQVLHGRPNYGVASLQFGSRVKALIEEVGARSLCDYGAGRQNLKEALRQVGVEIDYRPYDPAFPEYGPPRPADLVCCIDVLEHVEPEYLDHVLDELKGLTVGHGYFTVHTGPAIKHLPDGRNAHLIQQPPEWWQPRLACRFRIERMLPLRQGFAVVVSPLTIEPTADA